MFRTIINQKTPNLQGAFPPIPGNRSDLPSVVQTSLCLPKLVLRADQASGNECTGSKNGHAVRIRFAKKYVHPAGTTHH